MRGSGLLDVTREDIRNEPGNEVSRPRRRKPLSDTSDYLSLTAHLGAWYLQFGEGLIKGCLHCPISGEI